MTKAKLSKSAQYYKTHPEARKKKAITDTKINKRPAQKAKRAELGRIRRKAKKKGKNIDHLDYDHKQKKFMSPKKNRGQKEKSRLKGSKRKVKSTALKL